MYLSTGREVRIGKNCARGLVYGPRPQVTYAHTIKKKNKNKKIINEKWVAEKENQQKKAKTPKYWQWKGRKIKKICLQLIFINKNWLLSFQILAPWNLVENSIICSAFEIA